MRVYLALGSNLGDREQYLRAGMRGLAANAVDIKRSASIYSTEPREVLDQPWFLNTVVEADTELAPAQLLRVCLEVERENQRTRDVLKGPRTLDIDIVFYEDRIIRTPELTIPHPGLSSRLFVLAPLAEIAPHFIDPITRKTVHQLLVECEDGAQIRKL